ncbi:MAG: glycyl-radical enzyme activating protein [Christensenellales bacterium]|jgi:glycyl-radical enzyme activating protein
MEGIFSDIKRMSVHDGPGIRTTLFLKGCPLRCLWCHNPENLSRSPNLSYTAKLCAGCGACGEVCPSGVHSFDGGIHSLAYDRCRGCGACVKECYIGALKIFGRRMTAEEAAEMLLEDEPFYGRSGGGVTFSGGEPLMQSGFLRAVMEILKGKGIHIAADTCGEVPWAAFEEILPYTDLFLYDIKHIDSAAHRKGTGAGNERIIENLRRLSARGGRIEIRTPVIPGWNDDDGTLGAIAALLASLPGIVRWRLLPYHSMAKAKYEAIGSRYEMPETEMPDTGRMRALQAALREVFPATYLSSDIAE